MPCPGRDSSNEATFLQPSLPVVAYFVNEATGVGRSPLVVVVVDRNIIDKMAKKLSGSEKLH